MPGGDTVDAHAFDPNRRMAIGRQPVLQGLARGILRSLVMSLIGQVLASNSEAHQVLDGYRLPLARAPFT